MERITGKLNEIIEKGVLWSSKGIHHSRLNMA